VALQVAIAEEHANSSGLSVLIKTACVAVVYMVHLPHMCCWQSWLGKEKAGGLPYLCMCMGSEVVDFCLTSDAFPVILHAFVCGIVEGTRRCFA
jgi:hypothetical protein